MKRAAAILSLFLLLFHGQSVGGETALEIKWQDLIPQKYLADDPLQKLTAAERDTAELIIFLLENMGLGMTSEGEGFPLELQESLAKLEKKGLNLAAIVATRRMMNKTVVWELEGKVVRLPGYLLPLDLNGKESKEFLLVPTIGACIHTPPPPPNQIIHATLAEKAKLPSNELFYPVVVKGTLGMKSLSKNLFLLDGSASVDIGYTMQVHGVEAYKP